MATITLDISLDDEITETAAGTGSSVTEDVLVEYTDTLDKERIILALEKVIAYLTHKAV